jgi:hypothetical protein
MAFDRGRIPGRPDRAPPIGRRNGVACLRHGRRRACLACIHPGVYLWLVEVPARARHFVAPRLRTVLLNGLGKRPQMALEGGQGLNQCVEGPFSVFRIAAGGPKSVDKRLLAINNAAGFGDTPYSRRERVVGFCPSHKAILARPPQGILDLDQACIDQSPIFLQRPLLAELGHLHHQSEKRLRDIQRSF